MRDPNRIDPILARLRAAWLAQPDLRLGQLIAGSLPAGRVSFQAECHEFGAVGAPVVWPIVDRPAPTPAPAPGPAYCPHHHHAKWCEHNGGVMGATGWEDPAPPNRFDCAAFIDGKQIATPAPAPGLDLEAIERAERAMTPGPWPIVDPNDREPGPPVWCGSNFGGVAAIGPIHYDTDEDELVPGSPAYLRAEADSRGIVALRNAAPALIAEVRALRAEIARLTAEHRAEIDAERAEADRAVADLRGEIDRLTAELAAARAVPEDVEAALTAYAAAVNECGDSVRAARVLHSSIAFAIDNAVADFIDVHAKRLCEEVGGVWIDESDSWAAAIYDVLGRLRANEDGTVHDGRSEARQPATVGGLLPTGLHPDGCHTTDVTATRDCDSDGHYECETCTRFVADGWRIPRSARGPLPKGG